MLFKKFLLLVVFLLCLSIALFMVSRDAGWQLMGMHVDRVETNQKVVALTFDDGPTPVYTQEIVDILEQHQVKATFYLVGKDIQRFPDQTRLIIDAGHELGNHSYTHQRMVFKSLSFVEQEVESTDDLLRSAGQTGEISFRPPYGKKLFVLPYYLSKTKRTSVTWDVAPEAVLGMDVSRVDLTRYALEQTRPGSIILLHVMYASRKNSMDSVSDVITGLKSQGYSFVTVSELLALREE